jgi:hypothetical protein
MAQFIARRRAAHRARPIILNFELTDESHLRLVMKRGETRASWKQVFRDGFFVPPKLAPEMALLILERVHLDNVACDEARGAGAK